MKNEHWLGEQVDLGDVHIYYEVHGDSGNEPLLCLHNFSSNSRDRFATLLSMLTRKFRCYLIDLRGHGRSDNPDGIWTHEQFSQDVIAFCDALKLSNIRFLATSSGGMTMLRVARKRPDLVKAMVLDSATYRVPEASQRYYKNPDSLSPNLVEYYKQANEIYGAEYWRTLAETFYNFRLPECDVNQPIEDLREIITPTLIIHGDRDLFFPVDIPVEMKRSIPNSSLSIFPNTGHIVMETHPERVAEMAVDFLVGI